MPGRKASAWQAPTIAAAGKLMRSAGLNCASCSARVAPLSRRRRTASKPSISAPFATRNPAASYGEANSDLIRLSRKTPRTAAGIVPTSRSIASRSDSVFIWPRTAAVKNPRTISTHSWRYSTTSAVAVPRWRRTRNGRNDGSDWRKLQCSRLGTRTAWPSDETGNSSLAPCSRPMNSACAKVTAPSLPSPAYIRGAVARIAVFSSAGSKLDDAIARARAAETLGYDSLWSTQLPDPRDASLVLAALAANTSRLKIGTGVLPIYTRHPTAMVQMAATLDELSGGRFILGLGVSHKVTVEAMWGLALDKPVAAMRQYLGIVRASLRHGGCSIEGEFFTARWRYSGPRRADLPIMISALNPRMLELAGELADGVVLYMCLPAYIRDHIVPAVAAGREKRGKALDGFEIVAAVPVCLTSDRAAGQDVFRQTVARYARLPYYRKMMDASGLKSELEAGDVGEATLDELAGIGDEEQVRAAVRRFQEAGVTLAGVGPFGGHKGAKGFEA